MRKVISAFLAVCMLLSVASCDNKVDKEKEKFLEEVRKESNKYSFLAGALTAINSLTGMLGYYNDYSYQEAKETAKISDAVAVKYFPTTHWQGSEFLSTISYVSYKDIYLIDYNDRTQHFYLFLDYCKGDNIPRARLYKITYSVISDCITECEELYSTRRF